LNKKHSGKSRLICLKEKMKADCPRAWRRTQGQWRFGHRELFCAAICDGLRARNLRPSYL